ncbi:radical SAM protein, partial [Haloactinospora alba]
MQPTTLCNLDCSYCYLSPDDRKARREMPPVVARAVARSIEEQGTSGPIDLVWHGGEPLALRHDRFAELCEVFEPLTRSGAVRQFVQTNATLIDDTWCEFFKRHRIHVGVSLDGPEDANVDRVDWSGREAFSRAMRGVNALKRNAVPFSVICVVTAETVRHPDRLFEFFESLGAESVGFNFEEAEGANDSRDGVSPAEARRFWHALFARLNNGSTLRSRDAGRLFTYLSEARAGRTDPQADV